MKWILQRSTHWIGEMNARFCTRLTLTAVLLFLLFDFTALALNVWLSSRIESQAVYINLAGRQRMLSQRMVKNLLEIDDARQRGQSLAPAMSELGQSTSLFDRTLSAFARGGTTVDGLGNEVFIAALDREPGVSLVVAAEEVWAPYHEAVIRLLDEGPASNLITAVSLAQQRNNELLELMNRLTWELEQETQREAGQIRLYQGIAFLLALLNFGVAIAIYFLRMRRAHQERDLIDSVINRVASGVLVVDDNQCIIRANEAMELLTGYSESDLLGRPVEHVLRGNEQGSVAVNRDGEVYHCSVDTSLAQLEGRPVEVYTINDVTEHKRTEDRLSILAYHDQLTGLPNRLLFDDRLKLELNHCRRNHSHLAVLFIDLDKFKPVNDNHGHDVGDQLLRQVAQRLNNAVRSTDMVSRRGGDEFTLILTDVPARETCEMLVLGLHQELTQPYFIDGQQLVIGASIGVVIFPEDGTDAENLLRQADEAMYWAKQQMPGSIAFWRDIVLAE